MPSHPYLSIVLLSAAVFTWQGCKQNTDPQSPSTSIAPINYTIEVTGMHCDACAVSIQAHLEQTKGVVGCQVSYQEGVAEIQATDQTSPATLTQAIEALGFEAQLQSPG